MVRTALGALTILGGQRIGAFVTIYITPPDWRMVFELAADLLKSNFSVTFSCACLQAQEHALPKLIDACVDAPPF